MVIYRNLLKSRRQLADFVRCSWGRLRFLRAYWDGTPHTSSQGAPVAPPTPPCCSLAEGWPSHQPFPCHWLAKRGRTAKQVAISANQWKGAATTLAVPLRAGRAPSHNRLWGWAAAAIRTAGSHWVTSILFLFIYFISWMSQTMLHFMVSVKSMETWTE